MRRVELKTLLQQLWSLQMQQQQQRRQLRRGTLRQRAWQRFHGLPTDDGVGYVEELLRVSYGKKILKKHLNVGGADLSGLFYFVFQLRLSKKSYAM
jgi:hypothetical protein